MRRRRAAKFDSAVTSPKEHVGTMVDKKNLDFVMSRTWNHPAFLIVKPCLWGALTFSLTTACSNTKPETDSPDRAAAGSDGDDLSDAGTVRNSQEGEGDEQDISSDEEDVSSDEISGFKGCGFSSFESKTTLLSQTVLSPENLYRGFAGAIIPQEYKIRAKSNFAFKVDLGAVRSTSNFELISTEPPNAMSKAQTEIGKVVGTRTATVLSPASWSQLLGSGDWKGLHCAIVPVQSLEEKTGSYTTSVQFDPPLPYFVSPLVSKARFAAEFPAARSFPNLAVQVLKSNNPHVVAGNTYSGTARITPIAAGKSYKDARGRTLNLGSHVIAYKVEFNFGDHETTNALGLYKAATYYVRVGKILVAAIETGIAEAPLIEYLDASLIAN